MDVEAPDSQRKPVSPEGVRIDRKKGDHTLDGLANLCVDHCDDGRQQVSDDMKVFDVDHQYPHYYILYKRVQSSPASKTRS